MFTEFSNTKYYVVFRNIKTFKKFFCVVSSIKLFRNQFLLLSFQMVTFKNIAIFITYSSHDIHHIHQYLALLHKLRIRSSLAMPIKELFSMGNLWLLTHLNLLYAILKSPGNSNKSFSKPRLCLKIPIFEIQTLNCTSFVCTD